MRVVHRPKVLTAALCALLWVAPVLASCDPGGDETTTSASLTRSTIAPVETTTNTTTTSFTESTSTTASGGGGQGGQGFVMPTVVEVPDVIGLYYQQAGNVIFNAGLDPVFVYVYSGASKYWGDVLEQDPPGGTFIVEGTEVVLLVAWPHGETTTTNPNNTTNWTLPSMSGPTTTLPPPITFPSTPPVTF